MHPYNSKQVREKVKIGSRPFTLILSMKRNLLFTLAFLFSLISSNLVAQSPWGTPVGKTYYPLPSNRSTTNRIIYNEDDRSVSVTWTQSITQIAQPAFERGAGYNHMDADGNWLHGTEGACRINNACSGEFSGWPEIISFPQQQFGGSDISPELILSHSNGLKYIARPNRNTNAWKPVTNLIVDQEICEDGYGMWPRAVRGADRYVHMVAINQGSDLGIVNRCDDVTLIDSPLMYYRSSDFGLTWDMNNILLPELEDTLRYLRCAGDQYAIAANDEVVAVVMAYGEHPWTLWKSLDNGLTWRVTTICKKHRKTSYRQFRQSSKNHI